MKSIDSEIPIQNIYYMLSYAYNNLKINDTILKESVEFNNIYDLFARILINAVNNIIRRGFYKEYIVKNEDTSTPKGKINISESIQRRTFISKKLNCEYDEFSEDVLFNQIIKSTMDNLIRIPELNNDLKKDLKKLRPFFQNIQTINITKQSFKSLLWHKNNNHYSVIISICELIFLMQLPDDSKDGATAFKDFIQRYDKEMANLFENFVLNFYKKELNGVRVYSPEIIWDLEYSIDEDNLPRMKTDIVIENEDKQLIIDTKFYKSILSDSNKLNSGNLYQICSYVNNSDFPGDVKGMLLYASVGEEINFEYKINDKIIYIKTVDLNKKWEDIDKRLKEIINL
ncbi:hypothetical protein LJB96_05015 [Methanobrevibacter sp. OttesenSCG-928-K11]|nr:hypothetical protein [Methanobrevibacter sp. OttesenSCG-928-K11]MDL2271247.1 hypothetical protein [Methanobrevibacter sp. OttesenSCG-928-I08]